MKWIRTCFIAVCLFFSLGVANLRADMVPGPAIPERPEKYQRQNQVGVPAYSIASGVVAVSLAVSLVALRTIRKRDER
jgi:hypothetical protein